MSKLENDLKYLVCFFLNIEIFESSAGKKVENEEYWSQENSIKEVEKVKKKQVYENQWGESAI